MNYAEKNIEVKKRMEAVYKISWQEIWEKKNWTDVIAFFRLIGGGCSQCGGYLTSQNLKFFGFDVKKVRCYDCQRKN